MNHKKIYPRSGDNQTVYLKSVITRPNIEVGDFTITMILRMILVTLRRITCCIITR